MFLTNKLEGLGKLIVNQPFDIKVAGNEEDYIRTEGLKKLGYRVLKRKFVLSLTGQKNNIYQQVLPEWKKGLWIYERTAQIGDSLMDLATRSLWQEAGISLDLLTTPQLGELYKQDPWFNSVHTSIDEVPTGYQPDFIIVQSMHHSAIRKKIGNFKNHPWICMQGYYDVPDFCRSAFGVRRTEYLLGLNLPQEKFEWHARQKTKITRSGLNSNNKIIHPLTLILGGVHTNRTYHRWKETVALAIKTGINKITLMGTGHIAEIQSKEIINHHNKACIFNNLVNQLTLEQAQECLHETNTLITSDGGGMHMAVAAYTPRIISLFVKGIQPSWRLPPEYLADTISSISDDTDSIDPSQIFEKLITKN